MRTGAIFARGSCQALKWMALFGVVFALGAGSAAAQVTVTVDGEALEEVDEGALVTLTVGGSVDIAADADATTLTVTAVATEQTTVTGLVTPGEANDFGAFTTAEIELPAGGDGGIDGHPVTGEFIWQVGTDINDAEDEAVTVTFTVAGDPNLDGITVDVDGTPGPPAVAAVATVTIKDVQTQRYTLSLPTGVTAIMEGAAASTQLSLDASPEKSVAVTAVNATLSTNEAAYTFTPTGADQELTAGSPLNIATLLVGNDGNRMDETVTVTVTAGSGMNRVVLIEQPIDVTDIHKLPMLMGDLWDSAGMEVTSAMEGADYDLRVFPVDADGDRIAATEDWTVTLTTAGTATEGASADYTLEDEVTIAMNTAASMSHDTAALMVLDDNDLDPGETVMISYNVMGDPANGPGMSGEMGLLTVAIADGTMPQVTANSEAVVQGIVDDAMPQADPHGFNPSDSISFDPAGMFTASEGYELFYEVSSNDTAKVAAGVANGANAMVTLDAMAVGSAMITVTARARMASSATIPTQTAADWAQVMFDATVVQGLQVPGMPTSLMAAAGNGEVTLTWAMPADGGAVESYEYTYGIGTARERWAAATSPTTVAGLENGTEYTFEVRARNAAGEGAAAMVMASPVRPTEAPDVPASLAAMAGDGQVMLSWTAPAAGDPPTWYQYRASTSGVAGEWKRATSDTEQTVTGLTNGTEYTFDVRGVNDGGAGEAASVTATPMAPVDPVAPSAPQKLTAVAGDAQVTLSWTAPASGDPPTGYEYRRMAGGIPDAWMATSSMTEQVVTGLENGTEYTFEVRAMNDAGAGAAASVKATPMPPRKPVAPSAPTSLSAVRGDGQVMLRWAAPETGDAPTGYEYRSAVEDRWSDWTDNKLSTSVTVTGLTNGTEYTFEVRAVNSAGTGDAASVKATPMVPDPGVQVTVKEVKANTTVAESGGLEVTVVATVPAGTKVDDKVAPIASRIVRVSFPTDDASIRTGEDADAGEVTALGASGGAYTWTNITRTDKDSEQTYKFRVAVGQDLDAEDEKFQVEVSIDGASKKSKVITIDDAEEQTYVLSLPSAAKGAIKEGAAAATLTLKADPARTIDIPAALVLNPNDPSKYTLGSLSSDMFGIASVTANISAKADGNRVDDTITVTAYSGALGAQAEIASLDITVTDANALPAVKATIVKDGKAADPQPESVMEGETVQVMLTAVDKDGKAMKAAEKLTITLMPTGTADEQDYRLSPYPIEIAKDKESSAVVSLMVTADQDVGDETLMFDAAVEGDAKIGTEKRSVAGVLSLMITDGTQKLVWANSQEEVEAAVYAAKNAGAGDDMTFATGEMIEVMGALLFSSAEGVTLSYTAESSMNGVASTSVSGGSVMVTAVAEGMADITITAHANMASGVKILDQNDPGMASVMFPVEVGLEALSITLSGPEDMNLAEGMSAMVTATANRPVSADTTVMLMRDRAQSTAGDADYTAEAITISAGSEMGSTMVMAVEDNMAEDMEELVLYGMTEGMAGEVTGEVKLYLWDAAVPALPVIAQLLLAAFLAVGGYRRYRRR